MRRGVAFRKAHHLVGEAVALAEQRKISITQLSLLDWKKISPEFDAGAMKVFSLEKGLQARTTIGSPNPKLVKQQLNRWQKILAVRKKALSS